MYRLDIPAILASHNADHAILIRLLDVNEQCMFPVTGASGGLVAAAMVYFYVGELDAAVDLGREGLLTHRNGFSWAVQIPLANPWLEEKLRKALNDFDEALIAHGWRT